MKLWIVYGLLQVAALLTMLITQQAVFFVALVAFPATYYVMILFARHILGTGK